MRVRKAVLVVFVFGWLAGGSLSAADSTPDIHLDVKEFTLKNGMLVLVVERPATPQVAARLAIRAGSALEASGKTGIAHLLEHMLFKGTKNFGSLDYQKTAELQGRIDAAYAVVQTEQVKRTPDLKKIQEKLEEMEQLRAEAQKLYLPQVFSSQLGKNGAVGVNAFTTPDQTQYIASVPSDMLEQWFSIISEQLFEPEWREFYVEKEVVQREWAFRYVNNPEGAAWLDLNASAYAAHPYRNPVIGWKSDMERFSTQDAVDFHSRYYSPANAVCVLVGDVTLAEARRLAERYFERYPAGRRAPEAVTAEPPQQGPRRSVRFLEGARTPVVRIGFHAAPMSSPDFFALDALTMILTQGRSARLTQDIINQGLAVEAWAGNPDNRYGGMFVMGGSPNEPEALRKPDASAEEQNTAYLEACESLEKLLLAAVEKLKTEPVSADELERIKKLNQRDFIDRLRKNESVAGTLATLEVQVGWQYLTGYLQKMNEVTAEDIRRAAQRYLHSDNRTTVFVIPGGGAARPPEPYVETRSVSSSSAAERDLHHGSFENHSVYPTPEGWKHPLSFDRKPQRIQYPDAQRMSIGDTQVFFLPDPELPIVDLTIFVRAGSVDVEESKVGLTDIFEAAIIRGGTASHSPAGLAALLDQNAIRMAVDVGEEETAVRLSVLSPDWEKGIEILREVLTRPRFDPKVLKVAQEQQIIALSRQGEDAKDVAVRESMIWHFKGHPYGRDPLAALKVIPSLSREELAKFLATHFVPANMIVAVAGEIDRDRVRDGLAHLFDGLPASPAPRRDIGQPAGSPPVVTLIHKPGQVQAQVVVTLPGPLRTDSDYWKSSLLMNIFGGSDSLMYTRLRDDLGYVYSAGFFQTYKWKAGLLVGIIGCRGDKVSDSIRATTEIMEALRQKIPGRDLELKRLDALNSFVFNLDSKSDLVEAYSRYAMRQEPLDTLQRIQEAYFTADRDDLRGIAQRWLTKDIQVHVVADKTTQLRNEAGATVTLEEDLKRMAENMRLPFREIPLR